MNDEIRIGHAEREQAASALGEHFSAGRLDTEEFDDRIQKVYGAKTAGELAPLFADLPQPPSLAQQGPPRRAIGLRIPVMLLVVLLGLMMIAAFARTTRDPFPSFFLFPLIWFFWAGRHRQRYPSAHD
jgi:hypothetical protein